MRRDLFKGVLLGAIVSTVVLVAASAMAASGKLDRTAAAASLTKTITVKASSTVSRGNFDFKTVKCPTGYEALGGGVDSNQVLYGRVTASGPVVNGKHPRDLANGRHGPATGWYGVYELESGASETSVSWQIEVICSKPS